MLEKGLIWKTKYENFALKMVTIAHTKEVCSVRQLWPLVSYGSIVA